jgi:hypothetical protein
MSVTVDQTWVPRFHDTLLLTYQQKGSLLENKIDPGMVHRNVHAAIDHHERLGNIMMNDIVAPFAPITIANPPHSRRACTLQSSALTVLVSDEHSLRAMVNPQNGYTQSIVYAAGRRADKHIIDNLVGPAQVATVTPGSGVITYATQALPSARRLTIGGTSAWTLTQIIQMYTILSKSGVPSDGRQMLYAPGQLKDLLAITQASSSDFTKNKIYDRGTINGLSWEGFDWTEIADVMAIDGATTMQTMLPLASTSRTVIAFHNSAVGLSIGRPDGPPNISVRNDLESLPIQVRQAMMMTAVRVFEGGVVTADVLEN